MGVFNLRLASIIVRSRRSPGIIPAKAAKRFSFRLIGGNVCECRCSLTAPSALCEVFAESGKARITRAAPDQTGITCKCSKPRSGKSQLLRKADALQLSCRALGDLGDDEDLARHLEVRKANCGELPQVLLAGFRALAQHTGRRTILTDHVVGDRESDALLDARVVD